MPKCQSLLEESELGGVHPTAEESGPPGEQRAFVNKPEILLFSMFKITAKNS